MDSRSAWLMSLVIDLLLLNWNTTIGAPASPAFRFWLDPHHQLSELGVITPPLFLGFQLADDRSWDFSAIIT